MVALLYDDVFRGLKGAGVSASDLSLEVNEPALRIADYTGEVGIATSNLLCHIGSGVAAAIGGTHESSKAESFEGGLEGGFDIEEAVNNYELASVHLRESVLMVPLIGCCNPGTLNAVRVGLHICIELAQNFETSCCRIIFEVEDLYTIVLISPGKEVGVGIHNLRQILGGVYEAGDGLYIDGWLHGVASAEGEVCRDVVRGIIVERIAGVESAAASMDTNLVDVLSVLCEVVGDGDGEAGVLHLEGTLTAEMICICDRCGAEFESVKETGLEAIIVEEENEEYPEYFVLDGQELDLDDVLSTCLILDMETKFLCREDCKGLCPGCGKNLNLGPCGCRKQVDPRFAVLEQLLDKE